MQLYTYLPSVASVILKKVPAGNIDFINFTDFINFITQKPPVCLAVSVENTTFAADKLFLY